MYAILAIFAVLLALLVWRGKIPTADGCFYLIALVGIVLALTMFFSGFGVFD